MGLFDFFRRAPAEAPEPVALPTPVMRYDIASTRDRAKSLRAVYTDADGAAWGQRSRIAAVGQNLVRNNPIAARAVDLIAANVVGAGIIPAISGGTKSQREALLRVIETWADTTECDANGVSTLYGLEDLIVRDLVISGECIVLLRPQPVAGPNSIPLKIEVLPAAFIDSSHDRDLPDGGRIVEGIHYAADGRRLGYQLWRDHPSAVNALRTRRESRFVPADAAWHVFHKTQAGQQRGVSLLASVGLALADLQDLSQAAIVKARIAASFSVFVTTTDAPTEEDPDPLQLSTISPGRVQYLAPGQTAEVATPPPSTDLGDLSNLFMRAIAGALGLSHESLSGDYSDANFSNMRLARLHERQMIEGWQDKVLLPQFLQPLGARIIREFWLSRMATRTSDLRLGWRAPKPAPADPIKDAEAAKALILSGLAARSDVIRSLGYDPSRVMEEIEADNADADARKLVFDSDARHTIAAKATAQPADPATPAPDAPDPENPE